MKISTGIPIFNTPVDPQGTENQPPNAIFHTGSKSLMSHIIDVSETAIIVKAYGFVNDASTITVCTVTTERDGKNYASPMVLNGRHVQLSNRNNVLVIDMTGKYTFQLSDGLGVTTCAYHESGLGLWSFGLSAFAVANGMLQFVESETIRPEVVENTIKFYAKVSNAADNLIVARHAPLITDDPLGNAADSNTVDEFDIGGLYLGPTALVGNQYVSSSEGDDNNDGKGPNTPLRTIQYAVSRITDGTIANIFLKAGDTFTTYVSGLTLGQPPINGVAPLTDVVDVATFQAASAEIAKQRLQVGNRQLNFYPYGDTPITDIQAYNSTWGTGYNAFVTHESNWPTIKFIMLHMLSYVTPTFIPASISCGISGSINFSAINLRVGVTGLTSPAYINGCIPGNGAIAMTGGNIALAGIPLLGNSNGQGNQTFAAAHTIVTSQVSAGNARFNIAGTQLSVANAPNQPYDPLKLVVPADAVGGPLIYTDNGDTVESVLAPISFWAGMAIWGAPSFTAVQGADLRAYRRVRMDIKIIP